MNFITVTAFANGSQNPPTTTHPSTITNGDFTITGNTSATNVGDGNDERTTWGFNFTGDANYPFFSSSLNLVSARLTLVLTPKNRLISTDVLSVGNIAPITGPIQSLPNSNLPEVVVIELLTTPGYNSSNILAALSTGSGVIPAFYADDAIVSQARLELTQRLPKFQYAVKIVCGKGDGKILSKGIYHTAINIHNPLYENVKFRKKFAVALPGRPGEVTRFFDAKLGPDQALEIDCPEIMEYTGSQDFVKGFAIIESETPLDIVAVYTAANRRGRLEEVRSIHTERVKPRKRRRKRRNPHLVNVPIKTSIEEGT